MPRTHFASVGTVALAAMVTQASMAQDRQALPAFPSQAEAVTVDVVVLDKDGRPVRGLTEKDFTLLEDGRPQTVVAFQARELASASAQGPAGAISERVASNEDGSAMAGRAFAIVVDDLGITPTPMTVVRKALGQWIEEKADPRDEVSLVTTSGDAWWTDTVGRGRDDLAAVLAHIQGKKIGEGSADWMSDWEAFRISAYEDVTSARADSLGTSPSSGPPTGSLPGSIRSDPGDTTGRVVARWFDTHACQLSFDTAASTRSCSSMVRARANDLYGKERRRTQAVLGVVERVSRGLSGTRGRKSIIVVSEGFLQDPQLSAFDKAIDASRRGNTAVYFVDARGLAGQSGYGADQSVAPRAGDMGQLLIEETQLETAGTEYVADVTGGTSIRNTNDMVGGLERVAEESAAYYLLGYQPEKALDGKWHKFEVKVARPGLKVRARRGYSATPSVPLETPKVAEKKDDDKKKGKDSAKAPTRALDPAVMAGGFEGAVPVRLAPYVLDPDGKGSARVLVVIEVDTSRITFDGAGDRRHGALDMTLLGVNRDQGKLFPVDERLQLDVDAKSIGGWFTVSRELRLPAGVSQVRALVRDVSSGRGGAVSTRFEVPPLDKPYLATPVLTERIETSRRDAPRLIPVAHRRFRPKGPLYCQYQVYGMTNGQGQATMQVTGAYTLKTAAGSVVSASPSTMIAVGLGGEVSRMLTLTLDGMAEGEYELDLEVVDNASGRSLLAHEPFAVASEPSPVGGAR